MSYLQELLGESFKEGMTLEEVSVALESMQKQQQEEKPVAKDNTELMKLKEQLSKANSEAANYKKQLQAKMSDDEKAKAQAKEQLDQLIADNESMKRQLTITDNKAKLVAIGYPEDLAKATAEAMFGGDLDTVVANQKIMLDSLEQSVRADVMKGTPVPPAGQGSPAVSGEQFQAMSLQEKMELYSNDPELYHKLNEGGQE